MSACSFVGLFFGVDLFLLPCRRCQSAKEMLLYSTQVSRSCGYYNIHSTFPCLSHSLSLSCSKAFVSHSAPRCNTTMTLSCSRYAKLCVFCAHLTHVPPARLICTGGKELLVLNFKSKYPDTSVSVYQAKPRKRLVEMQRQERCFSCFQCCLPCL